MGSAYSDKFEVKVGVHQESVLSPLLFAMVVDVITENARRGVVNELLQWFPNWVPRDFARGSVKACESCCICHCQVESALYLEIL